MTLSSLEALRREFRAPTVLNKPFGDEHEQDEEEAEDARPTPEMQESDLPFPAINGGWCSEESAD